MFSLKHRLPTPDKGWRALTGCPAEYDLLAQPELVQELAAHAISLRVVGDCLPMPSQAFEGICQLTGLTSLNVQGLKAQEGQQISLHAISHLTALKRLELCSTWDSRLTLQCPLELSRLQALAYLSLSGFSCCNNALCSLPCLTRLTLSPGYDGALDRQPDVLHIPSDSAFLPWLAEVLCDEALLSASLLGLSSLPGLTKLDISQCHLVPECSPAQFSLALGCLTRLQSLLIAGCPWGMDPLALSKLTALTSLSMVNCGLEIMHCSRAWQHLKCLQLFGNRLVCMPENLSCLSSLTHLDLSCQQLAHFQVTRPLLPLLIQMPFLRCVDLRQGFGLIPVPHHWSGTSIMFLVDAVEQLQQMSREVNFLFWN